MDHVVLPLDRDHQRAVSALVERVMAAVAVPWPAGTRAHITLVAYEGLEREATLHAVAPVADRTMPFAVHAHGYGLFTGPDASDLSLHVPVVRTEALGALHDEVEAALVAAGAAVAPWSQPRLWSPHITLLAHDLSPGALAVAVGSLADRHHPSWEIPLDRLEVTGGWPERAAAGAQRRFAGG